MHRYQAILAILFLSLLFAAWISVAYALPLHTTDDAFINLKKLNQLNG